MISCAPNLSLFHLLGVNLNPQCIRALVCSQHGTILLVMVVGDLYCTLQTLLQISCLCVLAGSHWSFVGDLQRRGRGLERVCHFLGLLLHVEIKGCYLVLPFQRRDRSSSTVISETALVSLKSTHGFFFFSKYLSAVLSLTPFYPSERVKEASIVVACFYSPLFLQLSTCLVSACIYSSLCPCWGKANY